MRPRGGRGVKPAATHITTAYGCATVASADETTAKLTINPNAEIANMRSMAALHRLH
jgi:hypothetical protein